MPAQNVPPLWSQDNVTGEVSGFLTDILDELFKVVKLNYTITCTQGSYNDLGNCHQIRLRQGTIKEN